MSLIVTQQRHHLTSYHEEEGMILQFILHETIQAFILIQEAKHLLTSNQVITGHITKLAGYSQKYMRIFPWNLSDGILSKLKVYCSFFPKYKCQYDAERAWVHCLQCIDLVREGKNKQSLRKGIDYSHRCLRKLMKTLIPLILEFRRDENVIFFILRNQENLDTFYEKGFTDKIIKKMFPKGKDSCRLFLIKQYKKRGFENVIPIITQKLSELKP